MGTWTGASGSYAEMEKHGSELQRMESTFRPIFKAWVLHPSDGRIFLWNDTLFQNASRWPIWGGKTYTYKRWI